MIPARHSEVRRKSGSSQQEHGLYRLVSILTGIYFDAVWWIPGHTFQELHTDANRSAHCGGRLFRHYVAEYMAMPSGNTHLFVLDRPLVTAL
jgi:hypothetical protein